MTVKACVDCVFSHYERRGDRAIVECRRHAPRAWELPDDEPYVGRATWWPEVPPDGWCGEYQLPAEAQK